MTDIIAAVINSHAVGGVSAGTHTACRCNRMWVTNADYRAHITEHVAAELAKAGYGKLEDLTPVGFLDSIRADAWDEGAQFSMCYGPAYSNDNPYRGAGHE
jgi:hypothetical protein